MNETGLETLKKYIFLSLKYVVYLKNLWLLKYFYIIFQMEQHALKNVNNCSNTSIYSYLETSGGHSSNPYFNVDHFLNTRAD